MVEPVFAPNSRRVFFNSDRHGKLAIYSMQVEKLVEETEDAEAQAPLPAKK
jgi:oligogalacturonide lyase